MKKIVIIGANSYIARNLLYILKREKEEFSIELYDYTDNHVDGAANYKKINILDQNSVKQINLDCDVIFMFVGKTGSENGFDTYEEFININEIALLNLLNEYRHQHSVAKIIFPSTRLVYKGANKMLNEISPKLLNTVYAVNKYACEQYLKIYHKVFNVNYCVLRICIPYGTLVSGASSYGTADFMLRRAKKGETIYLYGNGGVRRTIIYIEDLCKILIQVAFSEKCINDVFNVGGENYSLKEMATMIGEKYSVEVNYIPYPALAEKIETGNTIFDDSKLRSLCEIKYEKKFENWCKDQ